MMMSRAVALFSSLCLCLSACSSVPAPVRPAQAEPFTDGQLRLNRLAPPRDKIVVAVYDYRDLTGQFKPTDNVQTLSRAVTQGGASVLIKALQEAGEGRWFTVLERNSLDQLLKERAIIREQRASFAGPDGQPLPPPGPLLYAGVIFEGGIIGFDSNTLTGGLGARYLGIGGSTRYRQDTISVYLRAISTQSGEVLKSVTATKTLASYALSLDTFKFIDFRDLLEAEVGFARNEPGLLALRRAVEEAVYAMVIEGAEDGLWSFADPAAQAAAVAEYRARIEVDKKAAAKVQAESERNPATVAPKPAAEPAS